RDRGPLFAQALEGRLLFLHEGHDDVAVIGRVAALDDDDVALVDAGFDHGVASDLEGEVLAACHEIRRHPDVLRVILNGADRHAGGDATHQGNGGGALAIDWGRRRELRRASAAALDDARTEAAATLPARIRDGIRQLDDLDGAGAVR